MPCTNFYIFITCESSLIYCMPFTCHLALCIWWCRKHFFFLLTCHHLAHVTASSIILHIIIIYIIACCFICHLASYIWWCSKHFLLYFIHATILYMSLLHPSSHTLSSYTLLHAVSSVIVHMVVW